MLEPRIREHPLRRNRSAPVILGKEERVFSIWEQEKSHFSNEEQESSPVRSRAIGELLYILKRNQTVLLRNI